MIEKLEAIRSLTGAATPADAARYVMQRGLEVMSSQVAAAQMVRDLGQSYSPEEMLPLFEKLENRKE